MPEARANLLGHRSKEFKEAGDLTTFEVDMSYFEPKEADPEWHPIAVQLYESALNTPLYRQMFLETDWAVFYAVCEDMSQYKYGGPKGRSAMAGQTVYSALSNLLLTVGERRRAKIETTAPQKETNEDQAAYDAYASIAD